MKLSEFKQLIKQSILEEKEKETKNTGAMTPEEEKDAATMAAIDRYDTQEKPNEYALDKEQPMEEARVTPDNRVEFLANALSHVWNMGTGKNKIDLHSMAQSLVDDMFDQESMQENSVTLDPAEVYAKYAPLVRKYKDQGMDKYQAIAQAEKDLAKHYGATPLNIASFVDTYYKNQYEKEEYGGTLEEIIRRADKIVAAWNSNKQPLK